MKPDLGTKHILVGPTASGKTLWAMQHVVDMDVDIISVDSCQVYRELNIGSAKVNAEERERLRHYLIDCVSVREPYDIARYLSDAQQAHEVIVQSQRHPLYLGGSMLYADKLMHGLSDVPEVPKIVWQELELRCRKEGLESLWAQLIALDPSYCTRLHPHDEQRILRALAVLIHTQQPLYTYWHKKMPIQSYRLAMIMPSTRALLWNAVADRVDTMLDSGLIEETQVWFDGKSLPSLQGLRSVGYRETWAYLYGDIKTVEDLKEAIIVSTMQYIKKQMTWMRRWREQADIIVDVTDDGKALQEWMGSCLEVARS